MKMNYYAPSKHAGMNKRPGLFILLPYKNPVYKGQRISIERNWFCTDCDCIFHLLPWARFKDELANSLTCQICHSKNIHWSRKIFKAVVDKKSKKYIHSLAIAKY
jgi:hypothetical protein